MARKRRLQSDSEDEQEGDQEILEESPQAKKKRLSSAKDVDEDETMEQDDFNCSQAPDFTVTTVSKLTCLISLRTIPCRSRVEYEISLGFLTDNIRDSKEA